MEKVSQKPIWFARGLIVVLLILIPVVKYGGFEVSRAERDGSIVYTLPLLFSALPFVLGVLSAIGAAYFWAARKVHPVFQWMSAVIVAVSVYSFVMAPNALLNRLILTPDSLVEHSGFWFSPRTTQVTFPTLDYMAVDEAGDGRYRLVTYDVDGNETSYPIGDLLKVALPDVIEHAAAHDIVIADGPDGWVIPSDLMP